MGIVEASGDYVEFKYLNPLAPQCHFPCSIFAGPVPEAKNRIRTSWYHLDWRGIDFVVDRQFSEGLHLMSMKRH